MAWLLRLAACFRGFREWWWSFAHDGAVDDERLDAALRNEEPFFDWPKPKDGDWESW